ncbi:MAG: polysaccharide biosynthesis/export family protein [Thermoanaerobaculia bacterium]
MRRFLLSPLFLVLAGLPALAGAAQESPGEYRLGPKDLLEIRVFEIPEFDLERRVSDAGTIGLPLLGEFSVSGLTSSEVRDRLQSALLKFVNRANVSVVVKEYASKPVSVLGAVQKPGSLTVSGQWPLLLAISAAGGLTEQAGRKIYVLRRTDNGLSDTLEVSVDELFQGSSPIWNIPIFPSDVVNIPARLTIRVFCLGEVRQPGALEFDSDGRITLLSVLAKAGGLTDRASRAIRIKRHGPDGKDVEMIVDFKRILSGKDPDPTLKPDDVVIVKESFF